MIHTRQLNERMIPIFICMLEIAIQIEQEQFLGAEPYEHTPGRRSDRNGFRRKRVDLAGTTASVRVPRTAGHAPGQAFYPRALVRGQQATLQLRELAAQMYVHGVSTRHVEMVLSVCGLQSFSSAPVSRAVPELDVVLEEWRQRALDTCPQVMVDARYEKVRIGGQVQHVAVLIAIGFDLDDQRELLGFAIADSAAKEHWRSRLEDLVVRGLHGVEFATSDGHAGLRRVIRMVTAKSPTSYFIPSANTIHLIGYTPDAQEPVAMPETPQPSRIWPTPTNVQTTTRFAFQHQKTYHTSTNRKANTWPNQHE